MIKALPYYVVYRILLGWSAEYTLRNAYGREVNNVNVQLRGEQIGRVTDWDLPSSGFHPSFKLKPDILDKNLKTYYEIKPSNLVGVLLGYRQLTKYDAAIKLRWPNETYVRGVWFPRDVLYFLEVPSFVAGAPIELPFFILAFQESPGLILYDELTLSAQAYALGLGTQYAVELIGRLGSSLGRTDPQILEELSHVVRAPQRTGLPSVPSVPHWGIAAGLSGIGLSIGLGGLGGF